MSTATAPRRLRAEQPEDLLALLPYLLGYHPEESLVMAVVADRRVGVCVRVDLDAEPSAVADRFVAIADSNRATGVVLVAYSTDAVRADRHLEMAMAELAGVGVLEALYVDGRRWWSRSCSGSCCPPEGAPYEIDTSRMAAEAVFAGMSTVAGRSEIERLVRGPDPATTERLDPVVESIAEEVLGLPLAERRRRLRAWVTDYVRRRRRGEEPEPSEEDLLRLGCLVVDLLVRDEAWALITRATAEIHVELWQRVVASTVSPLEPGPLCLLGMAAWIAGQGTLQVCCLERARETDPSYTMTGLLEDINLRALPPVLWDEIRPALRQELEEKAEGRRVTAAQRRGWPDWGRPWSARGRNDGPSRRRSSRGARRRRAAQRARAAIEDRGGP